VNSLASKVKTASPTLPNFQGDIPVNGKFIWMNGHLSNVKSHAKDLRDKKKSKQKQMKYNEIALTEDAGDYLFLSV